MMSEEESNLGAAPLPESGSQITVSAKTAKRRRIWLWLGGSLLVSLGGSLAGGYLFIQHQLPSLVAESVANFLHRPVKLGQVQGFSLNGVRFGPTKILATPSDPAHLSLTALELNFDLQQFFWQRRLVLYFNAIKPQLYIEQGKNGSWLLTPFRRLKNTHIKLGSIRWQEADLTLVARSPQGQKLPEFRAISPAGNLSVLADRQLAFNVPLIPTEGGNLQISGKARTKTGEINLLLRGKDVAIAEAGKLVALPLQLQGGTVDGNLEVQLRRGQLPQARGTAVLEGIQAKTAKLPQPVSDIRGKLRFQATQVQLEGVNARFGVIPATASGTVDWQQGCALTVQTQPISPQQVVQSLKLKPLPIPVIGEFKADLQVAGALMRPSFALNLEATKPTRLDKVDFRHLSAKLQGRGKEFVLKELQALPAVGGAITIKNAVLKIGNSATPVKIEGSELSIKNLPLATLSQSYNKKLPPAADLVSGTAQLSGSIAGKIENSQFNLDNLKFAIAGGTINTDTVKLAAGHWQAKGKMRGLAVKDILPNLSLPSGETLDGSFNLAGTVGKAKFTIQNSQLALAIGGGTIQAGAVQLIGGNWQARGEMRGLGVKRMLPNLSLPIGETLDGRFNLAGTVGKAKFTIQNSQLALALGGGAVVIRDLQLAAGRWQANLSTKNLSINQFLPNLSPQLRGRLNGEFALAGNLNNRAALQASGTAFVALPSGTIAAADLEVNRGNFTATIIPKNLPLVNFSHNLRGRLGGRVEVAGNLANLQLQAIQAKGKVRLTQGIGSVNKPLIADFRWNGRRLSVEEATSAGLTASGWTDLRVKDNTLSIENFAFNVAASGINLQQLPLSLPAKLKKLNYAGIVDFHGTVTGTPQLPKVDGNLALKNFNFATIALEPLLKGTVTSVPSKAINIKLAGKSDRLEFSLNRYFQPLAFNLQWQQIGVTGERQGEQMFIAANNIKLNLLLDLAQASGIPISPTLLSQEIGGELSGNFTWNFPNSTLSGHQIAIANPQFGTIRGDKLTGNFRYSKDNFTFASGQFQYGSELLALDGSWQQTAAGGHLQAEIGLKEGKIEDILETLQIFDFKDLQRGLAAPNYGKSQDLYQLPVTSGAALRQQGRSLGTAQAAQLPIPNPLVEVGKPTASLLEQLLQFREIQEKSKQKQQERQKLPAFNQISELKGTVSGKVKLASAPSIGTQIAFDIAGKDWQWGNLAWDSIEARGKFQKGTLSLEPLKIQTKESLLAFSGSLGGMTQTGKLQLTKIPLHQITEFAALPPSLNLGGWLNGTVTLGGSRENPLARGEWTVENANINQTLLQQTQGQFLYKNARLFLSASSFLPGERQPLTLQGSLPYQLPFATVAPDSERFGFSLKARDGGLSLLNAFTNNNLNWVSGRGEVNLDVFGNFNSVRGLQKLQAEGTAAVANGTIALRASPQDPLTAINAKINFDFDHIDVRQLTGNFKGGQVAIAGSLPLSQPSPTAAPLSLSFDNSDFNLAGRYRGGVRAQVQVKGTALKPEIGGQVALFRGVLQLEDALAGRVKSQERESSRDSGVQFTGLNLTLGDEVQVTLPPILNFAVTGNLTVNGSLTAPEPQGTVRLDSGYINLFASLLRLSGEDNWVEFSPERGIDPYLNLQLAASTAETTPNRAPSDPLSAEIQDPFAANTDSLRTVRIQAKIQGFASQLQDSIELTSNPARSEREILALLGGNLVNTLNSLGEEGTVVGLSNLASSAVFGPVQGAIGSALGLSEFRIFTTPLIDGQQLLSNNQIGVAAEASANLTDDLSLSFLKILNADRPPQVGLRYRIGDHWLLRGTSNFSDEGRATIEYEQRF